MRLFSNRLSIAVVAALAVAPCARAADPELLVIKATALELDKDHVDPSYTQISDATQAIFGRAIRSGDYYTGLRMTFEIDKESLVKNCSGGSSAGWYYVANVSIDYQGKKGRKLVSFVAGVPLVVAASNYDQKAGKLVKGCLLKLAPDTDPAYVLAEDFAAGEGEYRIRIEPLYGVTKDATVFQKVADLGLKIVAAWGASLFTINPQQAAVVTAVATDIDYLRSRDTQRSGDFTGTLRPSGSASNGDSVHTGQRLQVTFPVAIRPEASDGTPRYLAFYSRRSASIVLDWANGSSPPAAKQVAPNDVIYNLALGASHNCLIGVGDCKEAYFQDSLADKNPMQITGAYADADKGPPLWTTLHDRCKDIRDTAHKLRLSTVDALLVRWALLAKAGFLDGDQKFVGASDKYAPMIQATKIDGLGNQCWTDADVGSDRAMLKAITTATNKTFAR